MKDPRAVWLRIGLGGAALIVLVAFAFLVGNLVNHALHQTKKTQVTTKVIAVRPLSASVSEVTATVTSMGTATALVSCLVGIEMPSTPLAYPIRINETLAPNQTKTITVERTLIRPFADQVTVQDVAFVCT